MLFSIILVIITLILAIKTLIQIILPLKIKYFKQDFFLYDKIISYIIKFFIPYVTMVALNIKVILRLKQSKRRAGLNNLARQTNSANSATDKGARFTITTILIDVIFLVFNLPYILISLYFFCSMYLGFFSFELSIMFTSFGNLIPLSYYAALVLMFLIFNRIFRKELVIFLRLEKLANIIYPTFLNSSSNRV